MLEVCASVPSLVCQFDLDFVVSCAIHKVLCSKVIVPEERESFGIKSQVATQLGWYLYRDRIDLRHFVWTGIRLWQDPLLGCTSYKVYPAMKF